eukprot:Tamp_20343.p1 GENE.Tamp_20343~~Tamp_20343.p1  ORF type:complete len:334 (-),score=-5.40 Tamp_20343:203-1162(-)
MTDGAPDGAPDGAHGAPERSERGKGHGPGATDPFQTPTRPVCAWTAPAPPASKRLKYIARLDVTDGAPDGAPEPGGGHLGPVSTVLFETPTRPVRIRTAHLSAPPAPKRPKYIVPHIIGIEATHPTHSYRETTDGAPDGAPGAPERSEPGGGHHGPVSTVPFETPTRPVRIRTAHLSAPPAPKRPKYIVPQIVGMEATRPTHSYRETTNGAPDGAPGAPERSEPAGGHHGPVSTVPFETPTRPVRIRTPPLPAPPALRRPLYIARPGPIEVTCVEMGPLVSALKRPGGDVEDLIGATIGYLLATPMAYRSHTTLTAEVK